MPKEIKEKYKILGKGGGIPKGMSWKVAMKRWYEELGFWRAEIKKKILKG